MQHFFIIFASFFHSTPSPFFSCTVQLHSTVEIAYISPKMGKKSNVNIFLYYIYYIYNIN